MPTLIILMTVVIYGLALFLWVRQRSYRYTIVLIGGHLTILTDAIWQHLYMYEYTATEGFVLWGQTIPLYIILGASWFLTAPALGLFYAQKQRWWPRHYAAGIASYVGLFLYHLLILLILRSSSLWHIVDQAQAWGSNYIIFLALLAALVSLLILYALVSTRYYAAEFGVPVLLGSIFIAPMLVYGILGAPFWITNLIDVSALMRRIAIGITLGLIVWGVHLACWGLHVSRQQQVRWG